MSRNAVPLLRHLRTMLDAPARATSTDRELLNAFVARRDEAAFAALVRRHGPMVLNVCRHVLRHEQDAEDAFQAVFLVLARKAASLGSVVSVVGWLHGVAHRTAMSARKVAARRREHANPSPPPMPPQPIAEAALHELQALLDAEVARLPEKLRSPFVLCCLEGKAKAEAARELGWKQGTVSSRLAHARERLRARLRRRGLTLSAALAAVALTPKSAGPALFTLTTRACVQFATGEAASGSAELLAREVLRSMTWKGGKLASTLLALVCCTAGLGVAVNYRPQTNDPPPVGQVTPDAQTPRKESRKPTVDLHGDPLPPGAVARLGSLRFFHGNTVTRVVLSPDGKWVVSRDIAGFTRLWDARTGKESVLAEDLKGATFFATDDKLVAVKKEPKRVVLWDVNAAKEVGHVAWPGGKLDRVALSPNGKTLVTGGSATAGRLVFGDTASGTVRETSAGKLGPGIWDDLVFSADSSTLAVMNSDNSVDVWDVTKRAVIHSVALKARGQPALSLDGAMLAVAQYGGEQVLLYDVRKKEELTPLTTKPSRPVRGVCFSPDGKLLAATFQTEVVLWDLATRKEVRRLRGKSGPSGISCPIFSRDGKRLAAGDDNSVSIWDTATGELCPDFGHIYAVDGVAFSPDGRKLVSGAGYTDNIVRIWDPLTGQIKGRLRRHKDGIEVVAYSPDGKFIASGSQDGTVRLWNAATAKEVGCLDAHDGMIYAMAFSPDGKILASGGQRKVVHFWDTETRKETGTIDNPGGWTLRLAFSPDGKMLATRGFDEATVRLWDTVTGKKLRELRDLKAGCPQLSFARDSRTLAVNCDDGAVHLFDATDGREIRALADPRQAGEAIRCLGVVFAPDGRSLAAVYDDHTTRVWEVVSGHERLRFTGHLGPTLSLAYSPDGSLLVSGSSDHTALVWDVLGKRTASRKAGELTREECDRLWMDLADADAGAAYRTIQTLIANRGQAVAILKERMRPVVAADAAKIARLVADLDNEEFEVREKATKMLREQGEPAEQALRAALDKNPTPETRRRVNSLLSQLDPAGSTTLIRDVRGIEVLEAVGTPEARRALQLFANGAPDARLTREAKAALERLKR